MKMEVITKMADLVKVANLSVSYKIGGGLFSQNYLKAVNNVSLSIRRGSFFGLVGESGSGKTTLGRALLNAVPISSGTAQRLEGEIPSPTNQPSGCKFHTRCPHTIDICKKEEPILQNTDRQHEVACHRWKELFNI